MPHWVYYPGAYFAHVHSNMDIDIDIDIDNDIDIDILYYNWYIMCVLPLLFTGYIYSVYYAQ